jgi:hypothetical protein
LRRNPAKAVAPTSEGSANRAHLLPALSGEGIGDSEMVLAT